MGVVAVLLHATASINAGRLIEYKIHVVEGFGRSSGVGNQGVVCGLIPHWGTLTLGRHTASHVGPLETLTDNML